MNDDGHSFVDMFANLKFSIANFENITDIYVGFLGFFLKSKFTLVRLTSVSTN